MHGNWGVTITRHKKRATGAATPEAQTQFKLTYVLILPHQGGKENVAN
jgi:hypothetical protein